MRCSAEMGRCFFVKYNSTVCVIQLLEAVQAIVKLNSIVKVFGLKEGFGNFEHRLIGLLILARLKISTFSFLGISKRFIVRKGEGCIDGIVEFIKCHPCGSYFTINLTESDVSLRNGGSTTL